jgi:hypothetical protein
MYDSLDQKVDIIICWQIQRLVHWLAPIWLGQVYVIPLDLAACRMSSGAVILKEEISRLIQRSL